AEDGIRDFHVTGVQTCALPISFQLMAVFLARMVMPRSRSWSLESITRSAPTSRRLRVPDCCRSLSTRVVLPWSTWAMMAMLRSLLITNIRSKRWRKRADRRATNAPTDQISSCQSTEWVGDYTEVRAKIYWGSLRTILPPDSWQPVEPECNRSTKAPIWCLTEHKVPTWCENSHVFTLVLGRGRGMAPLWRAEKIGKGFAFLKSKSKVNGVMIFCCALSELPVFSFNAFASEPSEPVQENASGPVYLTKVWSNSMSGNTLKLIKDNDAKWVDLRFTDTHGKEQHLTMPARDVDADMFIDG